MSKRILVTGGAGFLGAHLCRALLAKGEEVFCLDNFQTGQERNLQDLLPRQDRFHLIRRDVIEPLSDLPLFDEIYNLACPASPPHYQKDPVHTFETCIYGVGNLLRLAQRNQAKILQASTSEIYGDPTVHPQPESYWGNVNPLGIRSCYDEGKRAAETYLHVFCQKYGIPIKIVRIFNTYGPGMSPGDGRVISNFILQALQNQDITIYGDGTQTRSFCYCDDLIRGLLAMMATDSSVTGPVNLGNPGEYTIREVAEKIRSLTQSRSRLVFKPLPQDDPHIRKPNIDRAQTLLNWSPRISLDEGLKFTIQYFTKRSVPQDGR